MEGMNHAFRYITYRTYGKSSVIHVHGTDAVAKGALWREWT